MPAVAPSNPPIAGVDLSVARSIRDAFGAAGADVTVGLATSYVESGLTWDAVGDNGTSFGPFQHHQGGALGSNPPSWAMSPAGVAERARAFASAQVHTGAGAAAVQRPADPAGYARKVEAAMPTARRVLAQIGGAAASSTPTAAFIFPVRRVAGLRFADDFGTGTHASGGTWENNGNDVFAPEGTPVVAPFAGTVRLGTGGKGGNRFHVTRADGLEAYGAHLEGFAAGITDGARVAAGQLLGYVGDTGNAQGTSPHLHFSLGRGGSAINPYPYLRATQYGSGTGQADVDSPWPIPGVNVPGPGDAADAVGDAASGAADAVGQAIGGGLEWVGARALRALAFIVLLGLAAGLVFLGATRTTGIGAPSRGGSG